MKTLLKLKVLILLIMTVTVMSCDNTGIEDSTQENTSSNGCGFYNGHTLHEGPQGGCYYINSNGNKTYVERKYCSC